MPAPDSSGAGLVGADGASGAWVAMHRESFAGSVARAPSPRSIADAVSSGAPNVTVPAWLASINRGFAALRAGRAPWSRYDEWPQHVAGGPRRPVDRPVRSGGRGEVP